VKGKSNGDAVKGHNVEKDTPAENVEGDGEVEDEGQPGDVRVTPVHMQYVKQTQTLTASSLE
jgi:hypothetical protein